jgi:hypothetical protein
MSPSPKSSPPEAGPSTISAPWLSQADSDAFYEALLDAHASLSREDSEALNARLILLLANAVGDLSVLKACVSLARSTTSK